MIHDIAIRFSFSNQARLPEKVIVIVIGGETIRVAPGQVCGPVSVFLEENELLLLQPENGRMPLTLQWTENNKLIPTGNSDWKSRSKRNDGHFELSSDTELLIIRYRLKVNRKTIALKFSAHTQEHHIDTA